ncbi:MFS transporter [Candidatus Bathyarchaeota archaeon]|nr:MFS transporter [Candidatus Bathyarchaeota archaeon]
MDLKGYWKITKEVFSNPNILSISLTTSLYSLASSAWRPFWPKYLKDNLGASVTIIGLFSAITSLENMLFQMPGGMLADRYGRKKIIVAGTFLRTFSPIIYYFAPSWEWIILASIFNGMTSLYMPAFTALVADSMPAGRRGTGYGAYNTITHIPNMVSPLIGGIVMDMYGYEDGLKTFLTFQIAVSLFITWIRWKYTKETIEDRPKIRKRVRPTFEHVKEYPKTLKVMLIVGVMGSFSMRLVGDLANLYALEVIQITNTQLGLISTIVGVTMVVMAFPSGLLSDRYGRKFNIMISRISNPISQWLISFTTTYEPYFLIRTVNGLALATAGGGQGVGGPAWNALIADIVPPQQRATVIGTQGTFTSIFSFPAGIVGGWLWQTISPSTPFQVSGLIGILAAAIFYFGVTEPTKEQKMGLTEETKTQKDVGDKDIT